jgi:hypothetical protein
MWLEIKEMREGEWAGTLDEKAESEEPAEQDLVRERCQIAA